MPKTCRKSIYAAQRTDIGKTKRYVCKFVNVETGDPCGQSFNERANLKVSFYYILAYYRCTCEECILTRNLTLAHSALKSLLS